VIKVFGKPIEALLGYVAFATNVKTKAVSTTPA
jgi:hypothetical protein